MHKMADKLYTRLQQECDAHVAAHVASLSDSLSLGPVPFLDKVAAVWADHCAQMLLIRQVMHGRMCTAPEPLGTRPPY
jgi:cullin-4